MSGAEVSCNYQLRDCRPPPESPSRTASFKTVESQLREGEQQRTSELSADWLAPFGELAGLSEPRLTPNGTQFRFQGRIAMPFRCQAQFVFKPSVNVDFNNKWKTQAPLSPKFVWGEGPGVRGGVCVIGVEAV